MNPTDKELRQALFEMLCELEACALIVELIPAKWPKHAVHFVRVAVMKNAVWYSRFCNRHSSSRNRCKFDTRIKRRDTLRLLKRMSEGLPTTSKYADDMLRFAKHRLTK